MNIFVSLSRSLNGIDLIEQEQDFFQPVLILAMWSFASRKFPTFKSKSATNFSLNQSSSESRARCLKCLDDVRTFIGDSEIGDFELCVWRGYHHGRLSVDKHCLVGVLIHRWEPNRSCARNLLLDYRDHPRVDGEALGWVVVIWLQEHFLLQQVCDLKLDEELGWRWNCWVKYKEG